MLSNYLKLGFRVLTRNRFFSLINIGGLAIGFAVFFMLWQYAQRELQSDRFHSDAERIVRFGTYYRFKDSSGAYKEGKLAIHDPSLAKRVGQEISEVQDYTRIFVQQNFTPQHVTQHGKEIFFSITNPKRVKNSFVESSVIYADANLFDFFNFPLKEGSSPVVLKDPYALVLSEKSAVKYFGDEDPVGKTLLLNDEIPFKVTGVFKNLPNNTHLAFDIVLSSATIENNLQSITIANGGPYCYLKLRTGVSIGQAEQKIKAFSELWYNKMLQSKCGTCVSEAYLQPLSELAFNEGYWYDFTLSKSRYVLIALCAVSILILAMGWINYVNFAISANNKRIKELAARKTVGASTRDIVIQFVVESCLINILSLGIAIALVQVFRQPAEQLLQFDTPDLSEISSSTWIIMAGSLFIGIVFTGIYPGIVTLRNSPKSLFGTFKTMRSGTLFGKLLTTFQFTFAIVLIAWVLSIYLQLNFVMNKDAGFKKNQVVVVDLPFNEPWNYEKLVRSFQRTVTSIHGVSNASASSTVPGVSAKYLVIRKNGVDIAPQSNGGVDEQFIPLYGIRLVTGRNFLPDNPADEHAIIISKATAARLGFTLEQAIGQQLEIQSANWVDDFRKINIIGVIEDYKLSSLFSSADNSPDGVALVYKNYVANTDIVPLRKISLQLNSEAFDETMKKVENLYLSTFPGNVFSWVFLDQQINMAYQKEMTARNQILFFTGLAIVIACLGLLGMITNRVMEKTKEMGVRQILGAEVHQLATLLLQSTFQQMAFAIAAGIPIAWMLNSQYLQKYSERIPQAWWHYALPIALLLVIMLLTVAYSIIKAVWTSPVKSLRYE